MQITGWGKYPLIDAEVFTPNTAPALKRHLMRSFQGIARGMGRSYGDSSLSSRAVSTLYLNHILGFDESTGVVRCSAGVTLADLLKVFVPRGWFPFVTPGTKFVTVGGAIASDVHGKNHHVEGSFSDHILRITIMLADGQIITCSHKENQELFRATCGGMGLTGIIIEAEFRLKPIKSAWIDQTTIKAANFREALLLFEEHNEATYSVAWIDCLASGRRLGRSLVMLGEHSENGCLELSKKKRVNIPVDMPNFLLNQYSIKTFNSIYYNSVRKLYSEQLQHYEPFFYPLDGVSNWNRIYGKRGFTQYQFVIPKETGLEGIATILKRIAKSGRGSFLAVLKVFGNCNDNYISFPMGGYTLALDFKLDPGLFRFLDDLDRIVLDHGGRLYLSKDVRMSESTFKKGYPNWDKFSEIVHKYGADKMFWSLQSRRLGI